LQLSTASVPTHSAVVGRPLEIVATDARVARGPILRSIVVDPSGYVLHEAGSASQIIPIEIDFAKVRRERERGLHGLGQPLKSFRDREVDFPVYRRDLETSAYLTALGPLAKPGERADERVRASGPGGDPV
jgi:hypothetical protein